jgi:hypothetical protein
VVIEKGDLGLDGSIILNWVLKKSERGQWPIPVNKKSYGNRA